MTALLRRRAISPSPRPAGGVRRTVWLLDLDDTLHHATREILPRIDRAMTDFVARATGLDVAAASALRMSYWRRYGATLLGMVRHHGTDPREFLRETHPFPDLHALVARDPRLAHLLRRLPGRKIVVTNAPEAYASGVLDALGVSPLLDGLVAIERMRFAGRLQPKPSRPMMRRLVARLRLVPGDCVLVEDSIANLRAARHCGVRTVRVDGFAGRGRPAWQRTGRGSAGVDARVRSVVQLARTPLASPVHGAFDPYR